MAKTAEKNAAESVASQSENEGLRHTEELESSGKTGKGSKTTRSEPDDLGVPMQQGDPSEPQGPEDALGPGPKRGDYSKRVGPSNYHPHEVVPNPDAKEGEPTAKVVEQRPRASDQGEEPGEKGGVTTEE